MFSLMMAQPCLPGGSAEMWGKSHRRRSTEDSRILNFNQKKNKNSILEQKGENMMPSPHCNLNNVGTVAIVAALERT
jgi:hypothetical protein